jgi:wobble nucleotide-excising tRNase
MLKKFVAINNVGRFQKYGAAGDVELKRYNLFFAENGRGKTTLCAILRSLQTGDPAHVLGRTTLGGTDAPQINILFDTGTASFSNGGWSTTVPSIAIFDATFVSENVYSGDTVDIEHRRSLYRIIVGKQGVDLAQKIDALDAASRTKSTEIRENAAAIQAYVPQGITLDVFLALAEDSAIDDKIATAERELEAVRQTDQINAHSALSELTLPSIPSDLETLLAKAVEAVAEDAGRRVAEQIQAHAMHARGEPWLSEGLGYIREDKCPFCNQSLAAATTLIDAYKAHFSGAYRAMRSDIATLRNRIETALGEREIAKIERTLDQNTAAVDYWTRYCDITAPALTGGNETGETIRALRQAALVLLDRKAASPTEAVVLDPTFTNGRNALMQMQEAVVAYNAAATAANAIVTAKKAATGASDIRSITAALTRLRATKKRHEPAVKQACQQQETLQAEKKTIEESKAAVRAELDNNTKKVIGQYEQTINQLLDDFNAGFRITETKHGYPGGVASSSYQILINNVPVELGDTNTPLSQPSFRNTLSSGDKSTLALAFFLAQLAHDPDTAAKIVVFDDPFNSQDSFRKDCTVQKIKNCGQASTQVLVLSHDLGFLKRIWDRLDQQSAERKCFQMTRIGLRNTTICEWNIEQATQDRFKADRAALINFYLTNDGNPRDVVQKVRPVLETYSRYLGAGAIADADTLGTIINKIRGVGASHQLYGVCNDLEELNDYTKRYHHGENKNAATEPISETELHGYVKRTLELTGGC